MADIGAMFRDKTKTADDILAALSDNQLRAGRAKGLAHIAFVRSLNESDDRNNIGHPNHEMQITEAGEAWLEQIENSEIRPYAQAVRDTENEMRRRGIL